MNTNLPSPRLFAALLLIALGACATGTASSEPAEGSAEPAGDAAGPRTVQPGAPGEPTREVAGTDLSRLGGVAYTDADVAFMQGMIPHHAQALQMTALVPERASHRGVHQMALRMEISQRDEIALMARWLRDRDEEVPPSAQGGHPHGGRMAHTGMGSMPMMPGMLSAEQMERLRAADGPEFDRLFLEYMIQHHEGAIVMVDALFSADGAGQESELFQFASHVDADQRAEIARMRALLMSLRP
jgi:uncharacterized protein (DUF305 family)